MPQREVPMRGTLKAAVWRLVDAAEALLENAADAGQDVDVDGKLLPDVKELAAAVAAVKVRLERQP